MHSQRPAINRGIGYSILFRRLIGLSLEEPVGDHIAFSQNQKKPLDSEVAAKFLAEIRGQAQRANLLCDEHFSVDGTLIEAWDSIKNFRPKDEPPSTPGGRNDTFDFKGLKLTHETHASRTDPDAWLFKRVRAVKQKLS